MSGKGGEEEKKDKRDDRRARLASQLRANLRKRKARTVKKPEKPFRDGEPDGNE